MNGTRILRAAPAVVALVVLLVLPQTVSDFRLNQMTGWIPLALAALGLNLLTGYNGQISVGHGALYGVGAYTAGLLVTRGQWPLLGAVAGAGVVRYRPLAPPVRLEKRLTTSGNSTATARVTRAR